MKKFSKILESMDSEIISNIKDILVEFSDKGFDIKITEDFSHYVIQMTHDLYLDWMDCVDDLSAANKRLKDISLEYIDSKAIKFGNIGGPDRYGSIIHLRYKLMNSSESYDNINSWEEFKSYCENVLGIDGIYSNDFDVEVVNNSNWGVDAPDKKDEGFYINYGQDSSNSDEERELMKKELISKYPKYKDFLEKYLEYYFDWNKFYKQGEWKNRTDKETPKYKPIPFNKEGIEVVKTLIEMTKKS